MPKKLADIVEIPAPSPALVKAAKKAGAKLVAFDPILLQKFILGSITLGELQGISKKDQYEIAKVGHAFLMEGKAEKANSIFRGLFTLDPYDAYFNTALGAVTQQLGKLDESLHFYTRALELNPASSVARAHRGEVYLRLGKVVEAVDDFIAATSLDPKIKEKSTMRAQGLLASVREQLEAASKAGTVKIPAKPTGETAHAVVTASAKQKPTNMAKPKPATPGAVAAKAPASMAKPRSAAGPRNAAAPRKPGPAPKPKR